MCYNSGMRLNKYLSLCGVASRRKADDFIRNGRVKVNGKIIKELGIKIDPAKDKVAVNNKTCRPSNYVYLALNKPKGYVCTSAVFRGEKSVYELLPEKYRNLKIAGRLDKNSEGLLILSDDGDFIYRLTHPKFKHSKEYIVELDKYLGKEEWSKLEKGVKLEEGLAKFDKLEKIAPKQYKIILHQGWKRQIRRMFNEIGLGARRLKRVKEGKLALEKIPSGRHRVIKKEEAI